MNTNTTNTTTNTQPDDAFDEHLFRLEAMLVQLAANTAELDEDAASDADGPASPGNVADQAQDALESCMQFIAAWQFREKGTAVPAASDILRRVGRIERPNGAPDRAEVVANIPWMLRTTLATLLGDDSIHDDPSGRSAVAARMLAAMLGALEGIDGMRQHNPAVTQISADVVPITSATRH